ncbi:molybdopterin-dependent oxidoreductase (plasmid) [Deinococcus taeanensis]|uniref:molybdopterin-dependent oxidoreductase n=1 Tax=Deinococcus taeanensis TaxID=2737050 RepID=UPI001CDC437B|nr:molybdopterin-dependent oxidoreductase [Deinococcus taeanensis]UBV44736.1 molybdopterin-dependent oxidoreductase [Deinococcus taeanensis]
MTTDFPAPGQVLLSGPMPRFGLPRYLGRQVHPAPDSAIGVYGHVTCPAVRTSSLLAHLPRTAIIRDFHCVTTWTAPRVHWEGWRFAEVWAACLADLAQPDVTHVMVSAHDGYQACVPLDELLRPDVLLADHMNGTPLTPAHGAPLRLIAPQLYGYKNIKHLRRLELLPAPVTSRLGRLLAHPRGRVDLEERSGTGVPRFWRWVYRSQLHGYLRGARALSPSG